MLKNRSNFISELNSSMFSYIKLKHKHRVKKKRKKKLFQRSNLRGVTWFTFSMEFVVYSEATTLYFPAKFSVKSGSLKR